MMIKEEGYCGQRARDEGSCTVTTSRSTVFFLALTDKEYDWAKQIDPNFPRAANEGYWTTEHLMKNLKDAVKIAELKYPR